MRLDMDALDSYIERPSLGTDSFRVVEFKNDISIHKPNIFGRNEIDE